MKAEAGMESRHLVYILSKEEVCVCVCFYTRVLGDLQAG